MPGDASRRNGQKGGRPRGPSRRTVAIRERILRDEELTVESTVEAIRRGQNYDLRCLYDPITKRLKHPTELTEEEAWCVEAFETITKNVAGGDGHTDTIWRYKFVKRKDFVELAAKHQGMLTEKIDVNVTQVGEWLDHARALAHQRNARKGE